MRTVFIIKELILFNVETRIKIKVAEKLQDLIISNQINLMHLI